MNPNEAGALVSVILIGAVFMAYVFRRFFAWKEKQLESETRLAAEKAAQYAVSNAELERRVRVLEQIVTDGGAQTAAQIEALREAPRLQERGRTQKSAAK